MAILLMVVLTQFLNRARAGKAIRAVAENDLTARLLGIHVDGIIAFTFFISSALGGAAGILFGLYFDSLSPDMGRSIELKGLAVIVLGGMGSIPGAIIGGLAFGLSEVLTVALTGTSNLRDAVAFTVLFAVLILRPAGIFGRKKTREAEEGGGLASIFRHLRQPDQFHRHQRSSGPESLPDPGGGTAFAGQRRLCGYRRLHGRHPDHEVRNALLFSPLPWAPCFRDLWDW